MAFTLTLVASGSPLSPEHFNILKTQGIEPAQAAIWLSPDKAVDIPLSHIIDMAKMKELRALFADDKIDVFCTRTDHRRKKLLIADMDSTIVTSETLDELADEAGLKEKISEITTRAMRGDLDFHDALRERVGLLKGLSADSLKRTLDQIIISEGADRFIATMRQNDAFCTLVSGGFTYFTAAIADKLGFHTHHGNVLNVENGKLTGTVGEPILDKESKLQFLNNYCAERAINISDSVAIGDGANDLPMLKTAGLGIGYHPKPILEEKLLNCILHGDLTAALYMQGYHEKELTT